MRVPLNDLSRTNADDAAEIGRAVADVIARGAFLKGTYTTAFESRLSERLGGRKVLGVANGTDALYLALRGLGVERGSHVATVANAGGYCTGAVLRCGGRPVFVDVDPMTAEMSTAALEQTLHDYPDTVAVAMTHLYGLMGDVDGVADICAESGIPLIEDCAQSIGAAIGRRPAGTFGQVATLSFYPTKNLGAFGDAGAVVSSTEQLHSATSALAQYGWEQRYEISLAGGINSRIDEMQAAVLLVGERSLDVRNRRRRDIVARFASAVTGGRYFLADTSERCVGHLAVMVTEDRGGDADRLGEMGVGTGVHYPVPDHRQRAWSGEVPQGPLRATEWLAERTLTVPCFPTMTDAEVDWVANALSTL